MGLFLGEYIFLHSGDVTDFKIECDALDDEDWRSLAKIISRRIRFSEVQGIPRGGERLAEALWPYASKDPGDPVLIADDVLTTGASFRGYRGLVKAKNKDVRGVCVFCRQPANKPAWVEAVFTMW